MESLNPTHARRRLIALVIWLVLAAFAGFSWGYMYGYQKGKKESLKQLEEQLNDRAGLPGV